MWNKVDITKPLIKLYGSVYSKTKKKTPYRKGKHSKYAPTITAIIHYNLTEILPEEIAGIPYKGGE